MMSRQIPAPISEGSPYMPVITYTMAWPMVMIIPNTEQHEHEVRQFMDIMMESNLLLLRPYLHFWAPLNRALSFGVSPTSMILAPASSCIIRPEVTIGEIPSSIRVPGGRYSSQEIPAEEQTCILYLTCLSAWQLPLFEARMTLIQ